jgi:hypothetical protein
MGGKSFTRALQEVLEPEGFVRNGRMWIRERSGLKDMIGLQTSSYLGSTVNIHFVDLISLGILYDALPPKLRDFAYPVNARISELMGEVYDKWWRRTPGAAAEVAEAVRMFALPFFEQLHPLESQANRYGRRAAPSERFVGGPSAMFLAVTLMRMGEREEACAVLNKPHRRRDMQIWIDRIAALRRHLGCEPPKPPTDAA